MLPAKCLHSQGRKGPVLESKQAPYERDASRHLSPALPWDSRSSGPFEASGKWLTCKQLADRLCCAVCRSRSVALIPVNCSDRLPDSEISGHCLVLQPLD